MAVEAGQPAPEFDLPTAGGGRARLADLKGKPLVLYFYPRDDTPGCTKEAQGFAAAYPELKAAGVEVVGVSKDGPASHEKFKAKYDLPFALASARAAPWSRLTAPGSRKIGTAGLTWASTARLF